MAPLMGEGLSDALARDFWRVDEDLWSAERPVRFRWLKLVWVYMASVVAQCTFALLLIMFVISLFEKVPPVWWLISVGGVTCGMLLFSILVATSTWIDICRVGRGSNGP